MSRLIYIGIVLLIFIGLVEFNPLRLRKASLSKKLDNISRLILPASFFLLVSMSFIDNQFSIYTFNASNSITFELIGIALLSIGLLVRSKAMHDLGKDFNYAISPPKEKLCKRGVYKFVRHPAYLGSFLYSTGIPIIFLSKLGIYVAIFVFVVIIYRINFEERILERAFGKKYVQYKRQTYKLIPLLY